MAGWIPPTWSSGADTMWRHHLGMGLPTRPGWGSQPIRQMMEANHVTAFFHGHDHQFAYESLNGMVYQAVPSGSFTGSFGNYTTGGNSGKRSGLIPRRDRVT